MDIGRHLVPQKVIGWLHNSGLENMQNGQWRQQSLWALITTLREGCIICCLNAGPYYFTVNNPFHCLHVWTSKISLEVVVRAVCCWYWFGCWKLGMLYHLCCIRIKQQATNLNFSVFVLLIIQMNYPSKKCLLDILFCLTCVSSKLGMHPIWL